MTDLLASEWLKLRSLRAMLYIIVVAAAGVLVAALLAWYAAKGWDRATPERRGEFSLGPMAELTSWGAQLCMAVLGVLAITSEYSSGMIRTSLVAVPQRRALLAAKATVVAGLALIVGLVITFVTFLVSRAIIADRPMRFYTSAVSEEIPLLLALGLSVMVFALVGLGLGAVLRSSAGAIATIAVLWYILPTLTSFLPEPWRDRAASLVLMSLPRQLAGAESAGVTALDGILSPMGALAVLMAYVAAPLGGAAILISRRDA